MENKGYDNIM
jgi:hypothetical protein